MPFNKKNRTKLEANHNAQNNYLLPVGIDVTGLSWSRAAMEV